MSSVKLPLLVVLGMLALASLVSAETYQITCDASARAVMPSFDSSGTKIVAGSPAGTSTLQPTYSGRKSLTIIDQDAANPIFFCHSQSCTNASGLGVRLGPGASFSDDISRGQYFCFATGGSAVLGVVIR